MSSSLTAGSPSPHFKFPCSPSKQNNKESGDYFTFQRSNYSTDLESAGKVSPQAALPQQQQQIFQTQSQAQIHTQHKSIDPQTRLKSLSQGIIYEEDDSRDASCLFKTTSHSKPSPQRRSTHSKIDSLSSIKTNGSDATLVEPYIRPSGPSFSTSTDTLFESNDAHFQVRPPPKFHYPAWSPSNNNNNKNQMTTPSSATEQTFFSRTASSPQVTPPRPLVRHTASLSQDCTRVNSRINKDMVHQLPAGATFISAQQMAKFMDLARFDRSTGLSNLIVIDVRPFGEHCKNHLRSSINICLSSTLLKRSSFDLKRCFDSLPASDKVLFSAHFDNPHLSEWDSNGIPASAKGLPALVFYDTCSNLESKCSSSLAFTASKFTQDKEWDGPVFLLRGGFQEFASAFPTYLSNHDDYSPVSESNNSSSAFSTSSSPASSIHSISSLPTLPPRPSALKQLNSSPILARFVLPSPSDAVFKTRHNEEVFSARPDANLSLNESHLLTQNEQANLPAWILRTIGNDHGSSSIARKFNYLETSERDRLRKVFSATSKRQQDVEDYPQISSGVELGNKNRYKDILPYEHSRVKLQLRQNDSSACDYINASYISSTTSQNRYIATQGPLNGTIGDFWSLVVSHRSPLILSLTAQNEGGIEKCAPFWEPGVYHQSSQSVVIRVEILEQDDDFKITPDTESSMILRRLRITINDSVQHEILQIQVLSWPDYGASMSKSDLLSLVALKKSVLRFSNFSNSPIIVHCSAGCGRTGTFCAIDSTIDLLLSSQREQHPTSNDNDNDDDDDDEKDPILKTVDCFRRQRISMVQTVRQYLLIYDTILLFLKRRANPSPSDDWDEQLAGHTTGQGKNIDLLVNFIHDLKLQ